MLSSNRFFEKLPSIGSTFDALQSSHKEYIRLAFKSAHHVSISITQILSQEVKKYKVLTLNQESNKSKILLTSLVA
jgi:phosphopantetheine adenylyltransferase